MNLAHKNNVDLAEELHEITGELIQQHSEHAAILIKSDTEQNYNIALWHLSVIIKVALRLLCLKHEIASTNSDSIEILFGKAYKFLPAEIISMEQEIYRWHNDLPYETKNAKTVDEAKIIGKTIQRFYNDHTVPAVQETLEKLGDKESSNALNNF